MCTFGMWEHSASISSDLLQSPPRASSSRTWKNVDWKLAEKMFGAIGLYVCFVFLFDKIRQGTVWHQGKWNVQPSQEVCNAWLPQAVPVDMYIWSHHKTELYINESLITTQISSQVSCPGCHPSTPARNMTHLHWRECHMRPQVTSP